MLSKHFRCAPERTNELCFGCHSKHNMKLIQQPGEEKLLTPKQKALSFDTINIFCMKIFFMENSSKFNF